MITSAKEYLANLQRIRDLNLHREVLQIPSDELVYNVDLNKRTVDSPEYLSTETDHIAETVFFAVDRYYEIYDLADSTCIIQYINAKNEPHIYIVPIFDVETYADEGKILIPWVIQGPATVAAGPIKYALRFYHLNEVETLEGMDYEFEYIINTQIATSKILKGMGQAFFDGAVSPFDNVVDENGETVSVETWQALYSQLVEIFKEPEEGESPVRGALNLY